MTTPVDPVRAAFVSQSYRTSEAVDYTVLALYPTANQIEIDTPFDATTAGTLATTMLNATKGAAQTYTMTIDGLITLADLAGTVPQYTFTSSTFGVSARVCRLVSFKTDWINNRTQITVRG
ncbi:hypothetical protein QH494_02485 [Sphingomonas sp. AR_OL41]|uniref:hypothetical protein n=1 Tax=Sphingomonas sp. AR_OL41 TaxID=3042729 RepID=UPI002480A6D0|nr:hypothetical protein [Sphingomonas sp. AR_OL41]MDH7971036.1 hypothetical protein [Sphingomonas sp. AR_OL41]